MTIEFKNFSFRYDALVNPTLKGIDLKINKGEKVLIIGPSGSGKSTLGQCINGLIPHSIEGETSGSLLINGLNAQKMNLVQFTELVGTVLQDTDSQFVGLSVGEDIAFALENQRMPVADMYPLVQSTAKMVELETLLNHAPQDLSGGQKQRVSLAGILVDDVEILLFDEPLAALDPKTGKRTIEIIDQLHRDTGKTIIIIEHRLEDVLTKHVDRVILMDSGQIVADMTPNDMMVSGLLEKHGIREPLYFSAMKHAGCDLKASDNPAYLDQMAIGSITSTIQSWHSSYAMQETAVDSEIQLTLDNITYSYDGEKNALEDVSFTVCRGEIVSVLGKNGSGKSTLTKLIMGVIDPDVGKIKFDGQDFADLTIYERSKKVGVVMQNPNHMICHHMIMDEVAFGLHNQGLSDAEIEKRVLEVLEFCGLSKYRHWPIDALSYGQKKRVTIASILVMEPELLILDEPTAGQDYRNYTAMLSFIKRLNKERGITVMIISHDLHLVLEYTTRSIVIADSKLITDAPMTSVFSQPTLLDAANLTTTSLYQLAEKCGIADINGFMQQFIDAESSAK
ncbi:ABC transporter ATP-binding protein [Enterovibrio nigricans]|uniref:Energy-coupling factor transport system ATP-binding protein n=1 Tax=Enterovibrio nigricans DSM 22720 TaxID=1121868 RepID=A0A1T4VBX8_9GAMM|nr:ABC transporter ATP-binding protein [Enterovibrio nigricans]PKF49974.1 heme ABC transporter ATP-binding protein [Enterovibrio nigricans]SKA62456.1 energy-coupling factor transport system ATP-binding protein [Enterovibrio nigricans DSM 22720]